MKTMIDTKIYNDSWFYSLSLEAKLLFLFLIGNDSCNLIGCYELPINIICNYTKIPEKKLEQVFEELFPKVAYCEGWIIIQRYQKYNPMRNPSIENAKQKQLDNLPVDIKELYRRIQIGMDDLKEASTEQLKQYLEEIENKVGIIHPVYTLSTGSKVKDKEYNILYKGVVKGGIEQITEEDILKICKDYAVPESFVQSKIDDIKNYTASTGKKYKDYIATLRNWVKKDSFKIRKEASTYESKRGIDARNIE